MYLNQVEMAKKIGVGGLIETIVVFECFLSNSLNFFHVWLIETIVVFEFLLN